MFSFKLKIILLVCCSLFSWTVFSNSLYSDNAYYSLHSDKKNIQAGSIVTVLIYEQASASTSAGTDTDKDTSLSGSILNSSSTKRGGIDLGSRYSGGGSISRAGKLIASVSVTVQEVLANGDFSIKGKQLIEFNNEKQFINLEGRIRPEDLSSENTVLSTRIADAEITYIGDGLLGKQQKPGFLSKLIGWVF